ncbi:MAG: hypothetical protein WCJ58_07535 [bacterium]
MKNNLYGLKDYPLLLILLKIIPVFLLLPVIFCNIATTLLYNSNFQDPEGSSLMALIPSLSLFIWIFIIAIIDFNYFKKKGKPTKVIKSVNLFVLIVVFAWIATTISAFIAVF